MVVEGLGASLTFKMPVTRRLRKLLKVWGERVGVPIENQAFDFGGQPVGADDTPQLLQMHPGETAVIRATAL